MHAPHLLREHPDLGRTVRDGFWVVALGVIACYAFFLALGAFAVDDVLPLSIAVALLVLAWIGHASMQGRATDRERDPRFTHARERRGF